MSECLTLRCSSFISSPTQLWSEHKAGSVLGLEVQKTVVRLLQMTRCLRKRRQHFTQQRRIQTGRWSVCSGLFSAAEWSVFGALFGATLPLETLRWCSESFCVHSIVQTSCQSSSEWSINQWPSGHPQLHQSFSFSRECVHMLSSVTVTASDWVSRALLQKEVWPVIIKKGQVEPLMVGRWLITTRDAC